MSIAITVFLLALVAVVGFVVLNGVSENIVVPKVEAAINKVCEVGGQVAVVVATVAVFAEIVTQILSV